MGCGEVGKKQTNHLKLAIKKNKNHAIHANIYPFDSTRIINFDIIEVPGHAPDQIALYDRTNRWLISGDLLLNHISSNALVEPDKGGNRMHTLIDHMNSLKKFLLIPIDLAFPGHGTLIEQPRNLIQKRLDGIEEKAGRLLKLIHEGITTGNDLAQTYYKHRYDTQFSLVMSEIIGHLDYLEVQGRINKELKEGVWHYSI
jgi:glyoxylase-like metal-dependent hydrolase (beta-lactamase superfamily II)